MTLAAYRPFRSEMEYFLTQMTNLPNSFYLVYPYKYIQPKQSRKLKKKTEREKKKKKKRKSSSFMASSAETKSKDLNNDDELICDEEENITYAAEIVDSKAFPMAMHAAIQLDLLEIIAKGGRRLSAEEIAAQLRTNNPDAPTMIDRMLCLLSTYSVATCSVVATTDGGS
ncbi:hypothetical protein Ancab_040073 [Ancistrocladus abbreviatus]